MRRLNSIHVQTVLAAAFLVSTVVGCGSGRETFPVAKTTGTVTCEGKPVPGVIVFFEPLQGGKDAKVGKQGYGGADDQGKFSITTYDPNDGAVVAKHRVRVGPPSSPPPGFECPCSLNSEQDVMEVEVVAGKANDFEVKLALAPVNKRSKVPAGTVIRANEAAEDR
jgi:hypothetical protein